MSNKSTIIIHTYFFSTVKKSKSTTVPVLLTRSKEDRERLIAEKVEKLVFLQEEFPLPPLPAEPYRLKSKTLKQCAITVGVTFPLSGKICI